MYYIILDIVTQYHKSQMCLKELYNLYSIRHPLSLDPVKGVAHGNEPADNYHPPLQFLSALQCVRVF